MTAGDGVIFTLHRVLPASERAFQPNKLLEITPEFLRAVVLQVRSAGYEFVSLDAALERLQNEDKSDRKFAVLTFDDGYKDILEVAYPVLKALEVPFTIFVTSEYSNHRSEPWWAILEQLIAENERLTLADEGKVYAFNCGTLEQKEAAFEAARKVLISDLSERTQRRVIRDAADKHGLHWQELCRELFLSFEELNDLAEDPLVSLGAHTDTHPMLARLSSTAEIRQHILSGMEEMNARLGSQPTVLAYPYGFAAAVDERCEGVAEELGFKAAVTTQPGTLTTGSLKRRFRLPRVSLNGLHQNPRMVDVYLSGAAFVAYHAFARVRALVKRT
ncbi:polysaccharide deacetylase family protein [Pseudovibrio axinellae]|nr:polysaccharide deacetylase family protein [Pseudovibrio axinellae]